MFFSFERLINDYYRKTNYKISDLATYFDL